MNIYLGIFKSFLIIFSFIFFFWIVLWFFFLKNIPFFKEILKFNKKNDIKIILNKKWGYKKKKQ